MGNEVKMKSGTITKKNQDSMRYASGINETLLRAEICFWKDMIAGCDPAHPLESLERMQQALALAESHLALLSREDQHVYACDTLHEPPSNVFSISRSSASRARNSK